MCRRPLLFFALALALCCELPAQPAAPVATEATVVPSEPAVEISGLGGRLAVTAEAESWAALVEKLQPTLTVDNHDLIWIGKDDHGQPQFTLDEAFILHPPGQPRRWVLLKEIPGAPFDGFYGEVMGNNLHGVASLMGKVPAPVGDAEIYGDFAVGKSSHPAHGTVYEIGWQKLMANGTSLQEGNRRLYLLQDPAGQWHFLGEGPVDQHGKSGYNQGERNDVESAVVWTNLPPPALPVEIHFVVKNTHREWSSDDNPVAARPDLSTYEDYVLSAPFPGQLQRATARPYTISEKGDTFDELARRNTAWESDAIKTSAKLFYQHLWLDGLARLNPALPPAAILPVGTKVQLLNQAEREAAHHEFYEKIDLLTLRIGDTWQGVVLSEEDAKYSTAIEGRYQDFWQPSLLAITQLEREFVAFLAAPENAAMVNKLPTLRTNLKDYHRQYVGIVVDGERRILINGLPRELGDFAVADAWRHGFVAHGYEEKGYYPVVPDSWEVTYQPAGHLFVNFQATPMENKK